MKWMWLSAVLWLPSAWAVDERSVSNRYTALLGAPLIASDYATKAHDAYWQDYDALEAAFLAEPFLSTDAMTKIASHYAALANEPAMVWVKDEGVTQNGTLCWRTTNTDCLADVLAKSPRVLQNMADNAAIIARYDEVFANHPVETWVWYPKDAVMMTPFPQYPPLLNIAKLQLAAGTAGILTDNIDEGLQSFMGVQQRVSEMTNAEQTTGILAVMVALSMQDGLNQYLDALLQSEAMETLLASAHLQQLLTMHEALPSQLESALQRALHFEFGHLAEEEATASRQHFIDKAEHIMKRHQRVQAAYQQLKAS
ncbi:Hypothetical protein F387_00867 [Wohlfahrtiimonas chitiniclastica SH04]|uniref:Imelysin-like domain-containing protein n=1 Tax=Wohlfahrtiimonas chitiniclastica SH04 TaxID=1261130 RepID=L8Y1T6_9GAMM|nr:hypothetical protein [Wohlfahrtiimonas chitiniclastica]ELV08979.1 Hypothetical protein F387_00867 [Wohlfahrtiimonas chitiniclastica SH04]